MTRSSRWILLATTIMTLVATGGRAAQLPPTLGNCPMFPADNIWNTPVDGLPVDPNSSTYVTTIGAAHYLHPDFGSGTWDGFPIGAPYNLVPGTQPKVPISFQYAAESDPGPYPFPPNALIQGGPTSTGDRHVLVVDTDHCLLYETWSSYPQPDGSWKAGSGALFDLKSNNLRPSGWTSADAAGTAMLPGFVRYDEVATGEIRHALSFTVPQSRNTYLWPARHQASNLTGSSYPPMGQRFRLKASFDVSAFSPETKVILTALKKYGMFLMDNGAPWFIAGVPDERWNNDVLVSEFARVLGSNFEAVDESGLMVDANSGQAKQASAADTVAPTAPGNLVAAARSSSRIDLTWSPSTDNTGVQGYLVYRNGVQLASVTAASYQNTGLLPATSYSYQVYAFDGAGNRSAASVSVSAVTLPAADVTPPSVPAGLAVTVSGSSQLALSWLPSKDNIGVTGYRIYRNGVAVATSSGTSYASTQLTPSTSYTFAVAAFDAAGNSSAPSAGVTKSTWPPLSTKFRIGSHLKASTSTSVRSLPGGTTIGTQGRGALGTVTGGPAYLSGAWWWQVDFRNAPDGWVNETRLSPAP
jgi:chitodextrinase